MQSAELQLLFIVKLAHVFWLFFWLDSGASCLVSVAVFCSIFIYFLILFFFLIKLFGCFGDTRNYQDPESLLICCFCHRTSCMNLLCIMVKAAESAVHKSWDTFELSLESELRAFPLPRSFVSSTVPLTSGREIELRLWGFSTERRILYCYLPMILPDLC